MRKFHYEYQCISQYNEIVADGEFDLEVGCWGIRDRAVDNDGCFALMEIIHRDIPQYIGQNHLKAIRMKVTNPSTGSVRYIGDWSRSYSMKKTDKHSDLDRLKAEEQDILYQMNMIELNEDRFAQDCWNSLMRDHFEVVKEIKHMRNEEQL